MKMKLFKTKKYYSRYLTSFLDNLRHNHWPDGYLEYHQYRISCLQWLKAYYDNKSGCTPKELLEILVNRNDRVEGDIDWICILYNWVYFKRIRGF